MKRHIALALALLLLLSACGGDPAEPRTADEPLTWQEQYDLGLRYLAEGKYEEAIIAFTAAIEIDPKRPEAYVGRGDAYVLSGETEENLTAALADYEKAIELDETCVETYLGAAKVWDGLGDAQRAMELLRKAYDLSGSEDVLARIAAHIKASGAYIRPDVVAELNVPLSVDGFTLGGSLEAVKNAYKGRGDYYSNLMKKSGSEEYNSDAVYSMPYQNHPVEGHDAMEFGYIFGATLDGTITDIFIRTDFADNTFRCMDLFRVGDDSAVLLELFGLGSDWSGIPDGSYELYAEGDRTLQVEIAEEALHLITYVQGGAKATMTLSEDGRIICYNLRFA